MSATGIVRCADKLGRIVVPKEWRNLLKIGPKDPVEMLMREDSIIIRKYAGEGQLKQLMGEIKKAVNQSDINFERKSEIMDCLQSLSKLLEESYAVCAADSRE